MNKLFYLILICFCLLSCEDIFIKDISNKTITIIAPADNASLTNSEITLAWETIEGAESYQVIVVSSSFDNIETFACDSVTTNYNLKLPLDAGTYEWSVQAHNSAYSSLKSYGKFKVTAP